MNQIMSDRLLFSHGLMLFSQLTLILEIFIQECFKRATLRQQSLHKPLNLSPKNITATDGEYSKGGQHSKTDPIPLDYKVNIVSISRKISFPFPDNTTYIFPTKTEKSLRLQILS